MPLARCPLSTRLDERRTKALPVATTDELNISFVQKPAGKSHALSFDKEDNQFWILCGFWSQRVVSTELA
jgi:hypothetical protein